MKTKPPFDGEIHAVSAKTMPDLNRPKREPGWFLGEPAEALPSQTSGAEGVIEQIKPSTFFSQREIGDLHGWCERTRKALYSALAKPASEPAGGGVLREALEKAEPFVELLHSVTNEKRARAIVWKALKQIRAALSSPASSSPAEAEALQAVVDAVLADLVAVHRNMLAGAIAKPSLLNIAHLYPEVQEMRQALIATLKHFRWPTSAEHETRDKVLAALAHFDNPPMTPASLSSAPAQEDGSKDLSAHPRAVPTSPWQDIATAPEDEWLLVATTGGWVGEAMHIASEWKWASGHVFHSDIVPLKWMPLPEHPEALEDCKARLADATNNPVPLTLSGSDAEGRDDEAR